jgi:hypothetical protein
VLSLPPSMVDLNPNSFLFDETENLRPERMTMG